MKPEAIRKIPFETRCFDFLVPGIEERVRTTLAEKPQIAAMLSREAEQDLARKWLEEVQVIFLQPMIRLIREKAVGNSLKVFGLPMEPEDGKLLEAGNEIRQQLLADGGAILRKRFPLSEIYMETLLSNLRNTFLLFLDRFAGAKKDIEKNLFEGRGIRRIQRLLADGGELHKRGHLVFGVKTDAGTFYYKPRDCTPEEIFREIVDSWFPDTCASFRLLRKSGYGFMSEIRHAPVREKQEIGMFFERMGRLTALLQGLGSTDLHLQNWISAGAFPAVVDLETMLPSRTVEQDSDVFLFPPLRDLAFSAIHTNILPLHVAQCDMVSPLYGEIGDVRCLPRFGGQAYTVEGFEEDFLRGFADGYDCMRKHREDIRAVLHRYPEAVFRVVVRNTVYYDTVRRMLFRSDAMENAKNQQKVLDLFNVIYESRGIPAPQKLIEYEKKCVLNGEIPYFCVSAGSPDLCGENPEEIIGRGLLGKTPLEWTDISLGRLSEEEKRFETDLIRNCLRQAFIPVKEPEEMRIPLPPDPLGMNEAISVLKDMFAALKETRIRYTDGNTGWQSGLMKSENLKTIETLTLWADVGLFSGLILRNPVLADLHEAAREIADACMDGFRSYADHFNSPEVVIPVSTVGWMGLGGILLALSVLENSAEDEALTGRFLRTAGKIAVDCTFSNELQRKEGKIWNLLEGRAGLVLGLWPLEERTDPEIFARLGESLLESLSGTGPDALRGMAGIGAALACCFRKTKNERFAQGAVKAFDTVLNAFRRELKNRPEANENRPEWPDRSALGGMMACASVCVKHMDCLPAAEVLRIAAEYLETENPLVRMDGLNAGNAMTVLGCLFAGEAGMPEMVTLAGRLLSAMNRRRKARGTFTVCKRNIRQSFDASALSGTVGIGIALALWCLKKDE